MCRVSNTAIVILQVPLAGANPPRLSLSGGFTWCDELSVTTSAAGLADSDSDDDTEGRVSKRVNKLLIIIINSRFI